MEILGIPVLVGFLGAALGIGKLLAPFLGSLFGGGAPEFSDLTQNTQDTSNLTTDALRQSQDLRNDFITGSQNLQNIDVENARSIGAFDPSSFGGGFDFLKGQQSQFDDVDFGARGFRSGLDRTLQIAQLAQQLGGMAPSMNLGIDNLLAQSGAQAGGGIGGAVGGAVSMLGSMFGNDGLGNSAPGPGGPILGGDFNTGDVETKFDTAPPSSVPDLAAMFGGGGTGQALGLGAPQGGGGFDSNILQQIIAGGGITPLIQALVEGGR